MRKITTISFLDHYKILCTFDNGEAKVLDLKEILKDKYAEKILTPETFTKAQIGSLGEIYWENMAEIKNLKGEIEPCNYDISPDLAYQVSTPDSTQLTSI